MGIQVPASAMQQFEEGQPWTNIGDKNIEGGHYVSAVAYDGDFFYVVTWGKIQKMSMDFWRAYGDEAWVSLSEEELTKAGKTLEGFDLAQLKADLKAI